MVYYHIFIDNFPYIVFALIYNNDNPIFGDDVNMPLITHHGEDHDDDYDDYNTPNTSRADETTFATPSSTDK